MNYMRVSNKDGYPILINFDQVTHVTDAEGRAVIWMPDGRSVVLYESMDSLGGKIEQMRVQYR